MSLWYARLLQRAARLGQHVVVLDADDDDWRTLEALPADQRRIDVWWFGEDSSRLALLFAYLMTRDDEWDEATIRVLEPAPRASAKKSEASLRKRLEELRIDADVEVVDPQDGPAMFEASADASFVLIPLRLEGMSTLHPGGGPVNELFELLPVVAMVAASGDVKLTPDETVTPAADAPTAPSDAQAQTASRPRKRVPDETRWERRIERRRPASIPIVIRLVRPVLRHADIGSLVSRQLSQQHAKMVQVKPRHPLVELLGQHVDLLLVLSGIGM